MRLLLTLLLAVGLLAACGDDAEGPADWTAVESPSGRTGLVWADAESGEIHLADGTVLGAGVAVRSFVMAGAGAYAVGDDGTIHEVTADGTRATTAHTGGAVKASPDGRYLAYLDDRAGEQYEEGTNQLVAVVVDLRTGDEVYRSTRGMGDLDDDLTSLYAEAEFGVLAVGDDTAWIEAPAAGVLAVDLATGDVTESDDSDLLNPDNPWVQPRIDPEPLGGEQNADGSWAWLRVNTDDGTQDVLVADDGTEVEPQVDGTSWSFEAWVDGSTVAGFADQGDASDGSDRSLMTCTVPDGACESIPGTVGAILPTPPLR